jgi:glycosyltransferase involved in cell wall biosynthesis
MDENDPIFPHQIKIARALSQHFTQVYVITNKFQQPTESLPANIFIHPIKWRNNQPFFNIFRVLHAFLSAVRKSRFQTIFSHMTEVQSAIIAPIAKILRIRHVLWYAHKSKSPYLIWNSLWIDSIVTSTRASCPIRSPKVMAIGQGVETSNFAFNNDRNYVKRGRWIHVGRIDPSKKIELLIELFQNNLHQNMHSHLQFIGVPTSTSPEYFNHIKTIADKVPMGKVSLVGKKNHMQICEALNDSDLFIHGFQGSLDKSLVEATLTGIPVITCNKEYLEEFGPLSTFLDMTLSDLDILKEELDTFYKLDPSSLSQISKRRVEIASMKHSQTQWLKKLISLLDPSL